MVQRSMTMLTESTLEGGIMNRRGILGTLQWPYGMQEAANGYCVLPQPSVCSRCTRLFCHCLTRKMVVRHPHFLTVPSTLHCNPNPNPNLERTKGLLGLAKHSGIGSEQRKIHSMAGLVRSAKGSEARWVVRTMEVPTGHAPCRYPRSTGIWGCPYIGHRPKKVPT